MHLRTAYLLPEAHYRTGFLPEKPVRPLAILLLLGLDDDVVVQPAHWYWWCRGSSGVCCGDAQQQHVVGLGRQQLLPPGLGCPLLLVDPIRLVVVVPLPQPHLGHRGGVDPKRSCQRRDERVAPAGDRPEVELDRGALVGRLGAAPKADPHYLCGVRAHRDRLFCVTK